MEEFGVSPAALGACGGGSVLRIYGIDADEVRIGDWRGGDRLMADLIEPIHDLIRFWISDDVGLETAGRGRRCVMSGRAMMGRPDREDRTGSSVLGSMS